MNHRWINSTSSNMSQWLGWGGTQHELSSTVPHTQGPHEGRQQMGQCGVKYESTAGDRNRTVGNAVGLAGARLGLNPPHLQSWLHCNYEQVSLFLSLGVSTGNMYLSHRAVGRIKWHTTNKMLGNNARHIVGLSEHSLFPLLSLLFLG